jgi:hypothetical protein
MMLGVGKDILLKDYPLPSYKYKTQIIKSSPELYLYFDGLDNIEAEKEYSGMEEKFSAPTKEIK